MPDRVWFCFSVLNPLTRWSVARCIIPRCSGLRCSGLPGADDLQLEDCLPTRSRNIPRCLPEGNCRFEPLFFAVNQEVEALKPKSSATRRWSKYKTQQRPRLGKVLTGQRQLDSRIQHFACQWATAYCQIAIAISAVQVTTFEFQYNIICLTGKGGYPPLAAHPFRTES